MNHCKIVCSFLALALSLVACGGSSESSDSTNTASSELQNKELVKRIYTEVIDQDNKALASELFAADYDPHDSTVPTGPDGEVALVQNLKKQIPGVVATIKHIGAEGDFVLVHWHASATPSDEATGKAGTDLYRVSGGKVAEHWGKFQDVPAMTASGNSMFSDLYVYKTPKQPVTEAEEAANEKMAVAAYKGLFNDRNAALLDQYWDPGYLQHNPSVPNGTDALRQFVQSLPAGGTKLDFFQTISDDDLVYTMGLNADQANPSSISLFTDIFRVASGKIVEHWDVN
jgi:predicted SnoaL-like aldol condensation-catalyzing enzyme